MLLKFYAQFYWILTSQIVAMVKMRALIEKEIALIMHQIVIADA